MGLEEEAEQQQQQQQRAGGCQGVLGVAVGRLTTHRALPGGCEGR